MTVMQIELSDELAQDLTAIAQRLGRPLKTVIQEAVEQFRDGHKQPAGRHRVIDIPPGRGLGEILKPWTSRAELLEDFYDRD